jgi:alpha-L-arabinofuranosidase
MTIRAAAVSGREDSRWPRPDQMTAFGSAGLLAPIRFPSSLPGDDRLTAGSLGSSDGEGREQGAPGSGAGKGAGLAVLLFALLFAAGGSWAAEPLLENAGFEADPVTQGWSVHVYGARPEIGADRAVSREGAASIRISSTEPSDVALGQNLSLPPGAVYRLRGWVRTRDLQAAPGVTVAGTYQIQSHEGAARVTGKSHFGTNDWTEEEIRFRVPADGQVRVAVFFVGFGKGTGEAWFDDVRLEPVALSDAERIVIRAARLREVPISPLQFGQFVEHLCDLIPGMHAERIDDDSFEGRVPYRFKYRGEVDDRTRAWYPSGAVHAGDYLRDPDNAWNGQASLRIRSAGPEPSTLGVSQDGIWVHAGIPVRLRLAMRGEGTGDRPLTVTAAIGGRGSILAQAAIDTIGPNWTVREVRLVPTADCVDGTLSIEFRGPGTLWLDRVSLVPEDACPGGWRPDVVKALSELKPGIIRFGGSLLEWYEWESGIGPVEKRIPFADPYWGGLNANNVGIDEFVGLCRLVGAEPLVCVRWSGKTPQDAANEVEYLNGAATTPYGANRAANGHCEPYGVKYFQIGNEISGAEYERTVADFARAMRVADPSIKLLSAFPSEAVMENAGELLDYLCPHHYAVANLAGTEADIIALRDLVRRLGRGRDIRLAVTEWNTTAGGWELGRRELLTLSNALKCSRYHNLIGRHSDFVEIANRSNMTNSFCSGIIQTKGPDLYLAPTYHAQALYVRAAGSFPVKVETALDPAADDVDVFAAMSPDNKTLRIYAVNESAMPRERSIQLAGFGTSASRARVFTLADRDRAGERTVGNSFADPDRIRTVESEIPIAGPEFVLQLPEISVTLVEIDR